MTEQYPRETNLLDFNSSFELGLRALGILNEAYPRNIDIRRLLIYDYLVIHSSDIESGPSSLHPSIPHRSNGILIRRKILQEGLNLMYSKNLIDIVYDNEGISYKASNLAKPFLGLFEAMYLEKLRENAKWVITNFELFNDDEINKYVEAHLVEWGGNYDYEFLNEEEEE